MASAQRGSQQVVVGFETTMFQLVGGDLPLDYHTLEVCKVLIYITLLNNSYNWFIIITSLYLNFFRLVFVLYYFSKSKKERIPRKTKPNAVQLNLEDVKRWSRNLMPRSSG